MSFTVYRHSQDFWNENQPVILTHILEAELIYLNARNNISTEQGFFGAAVRQGDDVLLAIQTKPYPMIFYANGEFLAPLAAQMAAYLVQQHAVPAILNGNMRSLQYMLDAFAMHGVSYRAGRHLYQRKCEVLADVPACGLPLTSARLVDYDFTADYHHFLQECHAVYDPDKLQQDITAMLQNDDLYVLLNNNAVVTMGRLQRILPHGRAVGVIYTPPQYRGHGYALCCTKQLTQRIFDSGFTYAYLYAEADNPISNHVYEKLGYVKTDDFVEYHAAT